MLHTGDFVEWSKYEPYWENMLDFNKKFLSKFTFMPISGNHETIYRNGKNEIYKHFNIKTDNQATAKGFYYCFDYSNTRFIMLNTYDTASDKKLEDDLMYWLTQLLSNNPKKWTIVAMHNPLFSAGYWGSNPAHTAATEALREQLSSLFIANTIVAIMHFLKIQTLLQIPGQKFLWIMKKLPLRFTVQQTAQQNLLIVMV